MKGAAMTVTVRGASTVLLLSLLISYPLAGSARASCSSAECGQAVAVDAVRELVAASCDCAGSDSHKAYLRCAKSVIKAAVKAGNLPKECLRTTRRCEARSTCGRDGAMVCCVSKKTGKLKALVKGGNAKCRGTVCPGPAYAADACNSDGTCAKSRRGLKSFRSVQKVFTQSCALQSCHSPFARQGGLVLDSEEVSHASLVDRPATLAAAQAQGLLRVKPGDPDNSFLIRKLRGQGPGDPMPQSGGPLPDPVIDMISQWIARGAHTTEEECPSGTDDADRRDPNVPLLCDPDDGPTGSFVWQPEPPLEVPAPNDGIQIFAPRRDVAPGTEWETCLAVKLDTAAIKAAIGVSGTPVIRAQTYRMHKGSHHLLVYMYTGSHPDGWPSGYIPCSAANCVNPGDCPEDAGDILPIGGTQVAGTRYEVTYPQGVGIPLLGQNPVIIVNEHYTNPFQPPQPIYGEAWLNIYFYPPGQFRAILDGIFAVNSRDLIVEPYETRTISSIWQPRNILNGDPVDAALFQLFGHMHKRGTLFQIDFVKDGKCSVSQNLCGRDEDCACKPYQTTCTPGQTCVRGPSAEDTTIYYTTQWDAAPVVDFPRPYFPVNHDQGLRWTCTHVNGVAGDPEYPPKRCTEGCAACGWDAASRTCRFCKTLARPRLFWSTTAQACIDPGSCSNAGTCRNDASTTCTVDSDCDKVADPPRVFAEGDPMPLVFGLLADDDMCNMFGYFINAEDLANLP
jgi:hypothetical protein